jgi:hypothetical protein
VEDGLRFSGTKCRSANRWSCGGEQRLDFAKNRLREQAARQLVELAGLMELPSAGRATNRQNDLWIAAYATAVRSHECGQGAITRQHLCDQTSGLFGFSISASHAPASARWEVDILGRTKQLHQRLA